MNICPAYKGHMEPDNHPELLARSTFQLWRSIRCVFDLCLTSRLSTDWTHLSRYNNPSGITSSSSAAAHFLSLHRRVCSTAFYYFYFSPAISHSQSFPPSFSICQSQQRWC